MRFTKKILLLFLISGMLTLESEAEASFIDIHEELAVYFAEDVGDNGRDAEKPTIDISFDDLDENQVICDGITIGNTNVSGMTVGEAVTAVNSEFDRLSALPVTIDVDDRSIETDISGLGFHCDNIEECILESALVGQVGTLINKYKDISDVSHTNKIYELQLDISEDTVAQLIGQTADSYTIIPVEASISRHGDSFEVTQSHNGIQIDQGKTIDNILRAFENWDQTAMKIPAATVILYPNYKTEDLSRIKDCIGSFTTKLYTSNESGKGRNVYIGAGKINGTVILPGQEWSIYKTLAPFNAENGYDIAIAYLNGGYVEELGGGVCQLATTLYNASLRAEIKVSERFCHQLTVGYTDIAFDATVNDNGSKDFKITNNFDFPVYLEAYFRDETVGFNIYGEETRDPRRTLGFRSEVLSEEYPTEIQEIPDPTMPRGTREMIQRAYPKIKAVAYKQVFYDGALVEEIYLHTDNYKSSPEKYRVGTR
ncbi:MAG: VanW family protein [Lachnospiraceae bacterium]|nr:VanW family protein [Lachnospiraceae bacterium]